MKTTLVLVPLFVTFLALFLYKYQDKKKELFNLDFVQFIYLFVIAPTLFIWMKSLLFYLLKNNVDLHLSLNQIFIIDTFFTLIGLLLMAVLAIHSLTKTFWIRRYFDPKFDVFRLSEYFHLWWSHVWMWTGLMIVSTFLSIINLALPMDVDFSTFQWWALLFFANLAGFVLFLSIWMSDPQMRNFMRLMKLVLAFFFFLHAIIYFVFDPNFNAQLSIYWFVFISLATSVFFASFSPSNKRMIRFRKRFLHDGWGKNKHSF